MREPTRIVKLEGRKPRYIIYPPLSYQVEASLPNNKVLVDSRRLRQLEAAELAFQAALSAQTVAHAQSEQDLRAQHQRQLSQHQADARRYYDEALAHQTVSLQQQVASLQQHSQLIGQEYGKLAESWTALNEEVQRLRTALQLPNLGLAPAEVTPSAPKKGARVTARGRGEARPTLSDHLLRC